MSDATETAGTAAAPAAGDPLLDHPAVARVRQALEAAGVTPEIVVLGEHARTAAAAAEQLGVEVAQIANSLVFAVPAPDDDAADDGNGNGNGNKKR